MYILIFIMMFNSITLCNPVEDGWKGIKPLKTNKAVVEKLLGKPTKIDDNDYYFYSTEDGLINVNYSISPCTANSYERGHFNIPQNTVLSYYIIIYKELKLKDLDFKREKYRRVDDYHLMDVADYINSDDGIVIEVKKVDEIEYVSKIYFYPDKLNKENLKCDVLKSESETKTLEN